MTASEDVDTQPASAFKSSWSDADSTAFLPTNLPVKRVARAWERKPHSPYSQKPGIRKVWRRVRMPVFNATASETDFARSLSFFAPDQQVTIESPKKAVKKQCLNTGYGQGWKTTEWDPRGVHMRKKAIRPPIVLRSGALIDPNSDDEGSPSEEVQDIASETASEAGGSETADSEWVDVESENEIDETEEDHDYESASVTIDADVDEQPLRDPGANITETEQAPACASLEHDVSCTNKQARDLQQEQVDSPISHEPILSPGKTSPRKRSPKKTSPVEQTPDIPALVVPSPFQRPTSAPPGETIPNESRYRPRISDDTAILHAFLSRAAASKKPIAKRESLTNRRDSGRIRHALASPAKPEVLAELDANSPSPHKVARLEEGEKPESTVAEKSASPQKLEEATEGSQPKRRSGRSRARPALLLDQMSVEEPVKVPNKITIRGSAEQVSLKKNEVQELAAQTRSNTRKNKGQSVMPIARLSKLADEEVEAIQDSPKVKPNQDGKNVRWDETLAYFSKSPDEADAPEVAPIHAADVAQAESSIEDDTTSPAKSRSKRSNGTSPKKAVLGPTEDAPVTSTPAPKPAPSKRRSRIATPAKGLLSKSLLPEDVTATAPESEPAKAPVAAPKKRALPTPKRSAHAVVSALKQCADDAPAPKAAAPLGLSSRPPLSPRKAAATASAIPSLSTFAPKMSGEIPKLSFEDALSAGGNVSRKTEALKTEDTLPGLASPAKRRRGVLSARKAKEMGPEVSKEKERDDILPGLMSPAKKRTRSAF
ncbi:Hypothetical protein D9617_3g020120 [Elsinoe fawcettii]|nr:Hypothetical protein D9617_3g020120 [Elsinoe fawcettii]